MLMNRVSRGAAAKKLEGWLVWSRLRGGGRVAERHDAGALDHEDHRPFRSPRAMPRTARDADPLARGELDRAACIEVHEETTIDDVEELVLVLVRMPREDAVHHAESDHGIVDAGEGLVVPGPLIGGHELIDVEALERREPDVEE